jgi:hypothetical protein
MPSQRLLKMMDPLGHVTAPRRVLTSKAPKAVVWALAPRITGWIAAELQAAGVEALLATSFRHVDASLRIDAVPPCSLAVIDFNAISEANIATLTTARWSGYRGHIIAVAGPGIVSAHTQAIVRIDAIVFPAAPGTGVPLRDVVARLIAER